MFTQHEFARFPPLARVFPSVLVQTIRMAVDLYYFQKMRLGCDDLSRGGSGERAHLGTAFTFIIYPSLLLFPVCGDGDRGGRLGGTVTVPVW
jgi:hypothetical protein